MFNRCCITLTFIYTCILVLYKNQAGAKHDITYIHKESKTKIFRLKIEYSLTRA